MKICDNLSQFVCPHLPIGMTIGNFDGVHQGHQSLLNRLKQAAPYSVVLTFSNHPYEILHKTRVSYLTTLAHRISLLEKMGVDEILLIPFTRDFSMQSAGAFLKQLKIHIPFGHLILGHDAVIGHDRKNDLQDLSCELGFSLEYLEPVLTGGKLVSSSEIRKCIQNGDLHTASQLLGRPYSILATVQQGARKGGKLGFHTANLPVEDLALPPFGVWAVQVKINYEILPAVANLGHAPTVHEKRSPCLEVHLLDQERNLYGQQLEVFFLDYLRPERRFDSLEALKAQIEQDISQARNALDILHNPTFVPVSASYYP